MQKSYKNDIDSYCLNGLRELYKVFLVLITKQYLIILNMFCTGWVTMVLITKSLYTFSCHTEEQSDIPFTLHLSPGASGQGYPS